MVQLTSAVTRATTRASRDGGAGSGQAVRSGPDIPGSDIQLVEGPAGEAGGLFSGLLTTYEQRGFERGYRRAVADLLGSLVWVTEEFLGGQQPPDGQRGATPGSDVSPADLRRVLYRFEEGLEQHLQSLAPDAGYVSDGLGI